jgi:hypothetical protein
VEQGERDDEEDETFITKYKMQEEGRGERQSDEEIMSFNEELEQYREITREMREMAKFSIEHENIQNAKNKMIATEGFEEHVQKKKKRKILKELKQYTGVKATGEKAYRGWPTRAHQQMLGFKKEIDRESKRYEKFDAEYRRIYATRKANRAAGSEILVGEVTNTEEEKIFDELFQLPEACNA